MSTHQTSKSTRGKLVVRLGSPNDIRLGTPAHPPTFNPLITTPTGNPKPSITDYTFEQYKAANLNIDQQHQLIGQLRNELPIIDRDEVDDALLRSLGRQLELAIFPTCKMMHVDPLAIKRMLDDQFRMAYGAQVEAEVLAKLGLCLLEEREKMGMAEKIRRGGGEEEGGWGAVDVEGTFVQEEERCVDARLSLASNKRVKMARSEDTKKEVRAYVAKRRRGKRACRIVTLRSLAVSQMWEALCSGHGL